MPLSSREVLEETGVAVSPSAVSVHCGWESAYPQSFRLGTPTRQHMIIYFIAEVWHGGSSRGKFCARFARKGWLHSLLSVCL